MKLTQFRKFRKVHRPFTPTRVNFSPLLAPEFHSSPSLETAHFAEIDEPLARRRISVSYGGREHRRGEAILAWSDS